MEKLAPRHNFKQWLKDNRMSIIVLAAALVLFIVLRVIAAPEDAAPTTDGDYAEYENAVVTNGAKAVRLGYRPQKTSSSVFRLPTS